MTENRLMVSQINTLFGAPLATRLVEPAPKRPPAALSFSAPWFLADGVVSRPLTPFCLDFRQQRRESGAATAHP
jgi:hypothetical protein